MTKRHFAVSYGNGNDGLSHIWPDFTLWCEPDSVYDVARLAMVTRGFASRRWVKANVQVDEVGQGSVQACLMNPPWDRKGEWCDANGAWQLCEVYPAEEMSGRSNAPEFDSPKAAFGRMARGLD